MTRVLGASVFKYKDYGEAWAQVEQHLATQAELELEGEVIRNPQSHMEKVAQGWGGVCLKESNPSEAAEYAVGRAIKKEPAYG